MVPVLEESLGFRCHIPQARSEVAPSAHEAANLIDNGVGIIPLLSCGDSFAFIEHHFVLGWGALAFLGFRDGCDELGSAAVLLDFLGWLSRCIQFPVPQRTLIGRVQDGMVKEGIGHGQRRFTRQKAGIVSNCLRHVATRRAGAEANSPECSGIR